VQAEKTSAQQQSNNKGVFAMKIGFIGLGRMGAGMAASLLKAGHHVTVYNRTRQKAAELVAQGAKAAASVSEACRGDAVITMLANDDAVESVVFDKRGIIDSLSAGATHISSSTISVAFSEKLATAHAKAGQRFIAAPVFGRPDVAAAGKLFIIAAGAPDAIRAVASLLDAVGQKTFVVSDVPRAANLVKLSGNFLIASVIESLGEAIALIGKGGVDQQQYLDILTSTLFNAPVYKTYGKLIVDRKVEPAGFAAPLGHKDIRLTLAAAEDLCVPMPLASLLRDRFLTLLANGGDTLDWSAIGQLAARDAGEVASGVLRDLGRPPSSPLQKRP
jgi:3-hydroxyisobutyrate dehydrogenase-like beta-hydroxyacid dehydrogenase